MTDRQTDRQPFNGLFVQAKYWSWARNQLRDLRKSTVISK